MLQRIKKNAKKELIILAMLIVLVSLWYTNRLVVKMAEDERQNVEIWAKGVRQKASFVRETEGFFKELRSEEKRKVELLAEATKRLIMAGSNTMINEDLFYTQIIYGNKNIPVILTDGEGRITDVNNVDFSTDTVKYLTGSLRDEFSKYSPIVFDYITGTIGDNSSSQNLKYFYYKDSKIYTNFEKYLSSLIHSFFSDVVINASSLPVIITDSSQKNVIISGNLEDVDIAAADMLEKQLSVMRYENTPLVIEFDEYGVCYVFYRNSNLLRQFRFFPYIQFAVISLFILLAYVFFSSSRRAEQNQVWAGMAKETAHQLGTPLSSLMAWTEMLKLVPEVDSTVITEMEKDLDRLNHVTQRFSKIGSEVNLKELNIVPIIAEAIFYLKKRTSKKVNYVIDFSLNDIVPVLVNPQLFQWVIENVCKNGVDAMGGEGTLTISITEKNDRVYIDIKDTGKGMTRAVQKKVFKPGFTTKKRGWGLGLTLAQRIISMYHKGKVYVKETTVGKGTTFRVQLNKIKPEKSSA